MQTKPNQLQTIAILQLVSGVVNLLIMWLAAAFLWGGLGTGVACVAGVVLGVLGSLVGCPLGIFVVYCGPVCGVIGFALIFVGLMEIVAGALVLGQPNGAGGISRVVAVIEVLSILAGGLVSCVIGVVVLFMYRDPEIKAFERQAKLAPSG